MNCCYCLETIQQNENHKNLAGDRLHIDCYAEYMAELDQLEKETNTELSGEYAGYYDDSQNLDYDFEF